MPFFTAPDGASIHFEDSGAGLPLLCLSGLTRNARDFDFVAPHLHGVRMIRMDYRGRGKSDWTGADTYTMQVEAGDILALMDHLGLDSAAILGTSRGGLHAMLLAAMAPDRVRGAALNDVGPVLDMGGLDAILGYLGRNPPQKTFDEAARWRMENMTGFPGIPYERWRTEVTHTLEETPEGLKINYDPALRDAVVASMGAPQPDLWPFFDALKDKPVAVIIGENSDLVPKSAAEEMAARHPGLIVANVPDRGHAPHLDEPEALRALTAWLEALE